MTQNGHFPYPGAIDADGHILEPPDLWEKYIEPKYRDRTIDVDRSSLVGYQGSALSTHA